MSEYKYKLTLEVEDCGRRTFSAEGEFDSQTDMQDSIPFDIARAIESTMNCPPNPMALAGARESECFSLVAGLAFAYQKWDAEEDFDNCMKVVVDVDRLCAASDDDRKKRVKTMLEHHGIEAKLTECSNTKDEALKRS